MAAVTAARGAAESKQQKNHEIPKRISGFDFYYQLIYMWAVGSAGISRIRIFQMAAGLPKPTATFFRRIHLLSQQLGYDYGQSCSMVGEEAKPEEMQSFLLRFSDALSAGQPEVAFLEEEAGMQGEAYEKEYERDLEALNKWTDAYAALVVSATLMIIINLISTLLYPLPPSMTLIMVITAIASAGGGAWVLSRSAPTEVRTPFAADGPPRQKQARQLLLAGIAGVALVCIPIGLLFIGLGPALVLAGLMLAPAGIVSNKAGREIERKDKEIGPFLRSLGGLSVATGTTLGESLGRMDLSSFPTIEPDLQRLLWRLNAAIPPELCWQKFAAETGSKLINDCVTVFKDAVRLGGEADSVGLIAAKFAAMTNTLRAKRSVVSGSFSWLTMVMHGVLSGLVIIILEIVRQFTIVIADSMAQAEQALGSAAMPLPTFASPEISLLQNAAIGMILILALINAVAIVVTDGDHVIRASFYLTILLFFTGLAFIFVPPFVGGLLTVSGPPT